MMYAIYNSDGSLKLTNLNEIITQGSTTTTIFIAVENYENTEYTALARYVLPNKTSSAGRGVAENQTINGITYKGWLFTLTQDETYYYGELLMSVEVSEGATILFTFPIYLTINKSGFVADTTNITITQYSNLADSIDTLQDEVDSLSGKTTLIAHELTMLGQLSGMGADTLFYIQLVDNKKNDIDSENKLKQRIYNSVSIKGYFDGTNTYRVIGMYVYNDTIYLMFIVVSPYNSSCSSTILVILWNASQRTIPLNIKANL